MMAAFVRDGTGQARAADILDDSMKLSQAQISTLIDDRYIERGRAYLKAGLVELTRVTPATVAARCAGTRVYTTSLSLRNGKLSGTCTCPAAYEFGPCKHMAATALAVMAQPDGYRPSPVVTARAAQASRLEQKLMRMSKKALADLVMQLIADEDELDDILSDNIE
jgi:uncharacterized Zn finger protein